MKTKDYTTSFTVDQSPEQVFDAINNVRGWWSEEIDASTDKLGAEFKFHSFIEAKDADDRAIGFAEDPAVKQRLAHRRG
jgi:hypothetical protein